MLTEHVLIVWSAHGLFSALPGTVERVSPFPRKNDQFLINMTFKKVVQTIGKSLLQIFRSGVFLTEYRNDFRIRMENFRDKSPQRGMVIF